MTILGIPWRSHHVLNHGLWCESSSRTPTTRSAAADRGRYYNIPVFGDLGRAAGFAYSGCSYFVFPLAIPNPAGC